MAAPIYDIDLTTLSTAEATTGWSDLNVAGGGGGALSIEIDFAIQDQFAVTRQVSNNTRGAIYTAGATTLDPNDHYFVWTVSATPGITNTKAAGGIVAVIGNNSNNWDGWYVNGSDTLPQGGMQNYAIHSSSTPSFTDGTGLTGNPSIFGSYIQTNGTAKGDNYAIDVIRYGTGFYITAGESAIPITFSGSAAINDNNLNRYGIITRVPGGFALKGKYVVGQTNAGTPTAAYFADSNNSVAFSDTEDFCLADFTEIIFDHPSTFFSMDTIAYTAIGTTNRGSFMVNNASTTGSIVSCTFNGIDRTALNTNVQVTGSTWIGCNAIYQSGSTIFNSSILGTTDISGSIVSDDPSLISLCTFEGDGTHHGIEVVATGEYNFIGNTFTGFVSGSNGGEELLFKPPGLTGDLTINVLGGGSNLEFRNLSSGTVTINNNIQVTLTGMKDFTEVRVLDVSTPSDPIELVGIENVVSASVGANDNDFAFSLAAGTLVDIAIISVDFVNQRISNFTIPSLDAEVPIQQSFDRNYSNPV